MIALEKSKTPFDSSNRFFALSLRALAAVYILNSLFVIWFILFKMDPLKMDLAGHVASASAFSKGLFHYFNDQAFLGYVHNLFYPPLEDLLVTLLSSPLLLLFERTEAFFYGYQVYLILLVIGLMSTIWVISKMGTGLPRVLFLSLVLIWINSNAGFGLSWQGLRFYDIVITGLSNQVLSWIFFLWYFRAFHKNENVYLQSLFFSLSFLSHLVGALVAVLFLATQIFASIRLCFLGRNLALLKKNLVVGVLSAAISSIVWLPFLSHVWVSTTSTIYSNIHWAWIIPISLCTFFIPSRYALGYLSLFLFSIILFGRSLKEGLLGAVTIELPPFHYYRFASYCFWLFCLGLLVSRKSSLAGFEFFKKGGRLYSAGILSLFLIAIGNNPSFLSDLDFSGSTTISTVRVVRDSVLSSVKSDSYSRYWVQTPDRPIDFGVESMLQTGSNTFLSHKGLFWESHRSNTLISSYHATLFGLPVVLDYYYFPKARCEIKKCFIKNMVREFGIEKIAMPLDLSSFQLGAEETACLKEGLSELEQDQLNKIQMHEGNHVSRFTLRSREFEISKVSDMYNLGPVEIIQSSQLFAASFKERRFFDKLIDKKYLACSLNISDYPVFVNDESFDAFSDELKEFSDSDLSDRPEIIFTRIESGQYEVHIKSELPVVFWVKLSYFPGWKAVDESGSDIRLIEAFPGMVGFGQGKIKLTYHRTIQMKVSYFLSLIGLALCLCGLFVRDYLQPWLEFDFSQSEP